MRNIFILAMAGVFIFFSVGLPSAWSEETARNISVIDMAGKVEIMRDGTGIWASAVSDTKLGAGDIIRTGPGSRADLDFAGKAQAAVVRVNENSSMKIDAYVSSEKIEDRKITLDLTVGDILVKVNKVKNKSQFQVRTPTSIVGVRGTMFRVKTAVAE